MNTYQRNIVCLTFMCLSAAHSASTQTSGAKPQNMADTYGHLSLSFEANQGQTDRRVKFLSRGSGYSLFLTQEEAVLALKKKGNRVSPSVNPASVVFAKGGAEPESEAVLRMRLVGAIATAQVTGLEELPGKSNYFISHDSTKWQTGIRNYAKVKYANVYPGVDLVYYGNQRQLEFDLVVQPGADPKAIRLGFQTAMNGEQAALRIDEKGDLVVGTKGEKVIFHKPVVYQPATNHETPATHKELIDGKFVLTGVHQVSFQIAAYDKSRPLVIDPTLVYSTYLGGSVEDEGGGAIAVDASGNAYVTGETLSSNFPTTAGAFQSTLKGFRNVFVSKLNAAGSALLYSTYLGDDGFGRGIAVDASGNVYVGGLTSSSDFPVTPGAFQPTKGGNDDVFVSKLNAAGSALIYSTYLGGSGSDGGGDGFGIAIDALGNAYITSQTLSSNFPTTPGAFLPTPGEGFGRVQDAFVSKLNATGSALVYSTYLGSTDTAGFGIAVDASGNAYVAGFTNSSAFPTTPGAFSEAGNGFITKLNAAGSALVYSARLRGYEVCSGIAIDASGNAYVTGHTSSSDFPTTPGAFQTICGGCNLAANLGDAFITKLNPTGSTLVYSTFLGGGRDEGGNSIAIDAEGNAYVSGSTTSSDFPTTTDAFQTTFGGSGGFIGDAFFTKLNAAGSATLYSTYLGGSNIDNSNGIAVDASDNAYVTGYSFSSNFPTTPGAFQTTFGGTVDAFISKFSFGIPFCSFRSRLELDVDGDRDDGFELGARFALGAGGSIHPTTQPVTLTIANYSVTIPSGSFVKRHEGYEFTGVINGVRLAVLIRDRHSEKGDHHDDEDNDNKDRDHDRCTTSTYTILAKGRGAILKGTANPVTVTINIGDNTGTTQVHAELER